MPYDKAWEVAYQRDRAAGRRRYVRSGPVRARLEELSGAKVPLRALGRATGLSDTAVKALLAGERTHVQWQTAQRVERLRLADVYRSQACGHVPRLGAVRRVQALLAMGWTHADLAAAGAANTGKLVATKGDLITAVRWREVCAVYERLGMTPGRSPETRSRAKALGYAPPLAWDDATIDDPAAAPRAGGKPWGGANVLDEVAVRRAIDHPGTAVRLNRAERREVVWTMAAQGASDAQIGEHLGVVDRTVLRVRQRDGIPAGRPGPAPADPMTAPSSRPRPGSTAGPGRPGGRAVSRPG